MAPICNTDQVTVEYATLHSAWPIIASMEIKYGLPHFFLYAIAMQETDAKNLCPCPTPQCIGDGATGFGIFQYTPPVGTLTPYNFCSRIWLQADIAAAHLATTCYTKCGTWLGAAECYNSGHCDGAPAYGENVICFMDQLQAAGLPYPGYPGGD